MNGGIMKKLTACVVLAVLLLNALALAVEGQGYPEWDGSTVPDDSFCASIDGTNIALSFDSRQEYSNVMDDQIQVCFFAYDATEEHYLELYLLFPDSALAGDSYFSGDGTLSCVSLYESGMDGEDYYCADEAGSDGTSFEISVDAAQISSSAISMTGSVNAVLCQYDEDDSPLRNSMRIEAGRFNFTLPLYNDGFAPAVTPTPGVDNPQATFPVPPYGDAPQVTFPALPDVTAEPALPKVGDRPSFTLPPDYAVI